MVDENGLGEAATILGEAASSPFASTLTPRGTETLVNTTTLGNQNEPEIAALSDGGYVVVWRDARSTGTSTQENSIRAQIFNADGTMRSGEIVVDTFQARSSQTLTPTVVGLTDGGFAVSWTDIASTSGDIRAQIYEANGSLRGNIIPINAATNNDQTDNQITALADGRFLITWTDDSRVSGDTSSTAVRGQIVNANGSLSGAEFLVNTTTSSTQDESTVAALSGGGFVVAWIDNSTGTNRLLFQRYDNTATKQGGEVVVATGATLADPDITGLANGGFVISWDQQSGSGDSSGRSVQAQIFNATGGTVSGPLRVNTTTANDQVDSSITALPLGGFAVSWTDSSASGGDTSATAVRAQVYTDTGGRIGGELLVNTTTTNAQLDPSIAALADNSLAIAFSDESEGAGQTTPDDASGSAVRVQRLEFVGAPTATNDAVTVGEDAAAQLTTLLANDTDPANQTLSIVAINATGSMGTVTLANGVVTYNPNGRFESLGVGQTATDTFSYVIQDTANLRDSATVTVTITGANDAPVAVNDTASTLAGAPVTVSVLTNDTDIDGDTLSVSAATSANGTATIVGGTQILFTPTFGFSGIADVTYTVSDGQGGTATGTLSVTVGASTPTTDGTELVANTTTTGNQEAPSLAGLTGGGFVAAWEDASATGGDTSVTAIRAQVYNAAGARVGTEILVNSSTQLFQRDPAVTGLAGDGFLVLYEDNSGTNGGNASGDDTSGFAIRGQLFGAGGTPTGTEFQVNTTTLGNQLDVDVATLAGGGFVGVWEDSSATGGDTANFAVRGRVYNADGSARSAEFLINTSTASNQLNATVAGLSDGSFVVAWEDASTSAGDTSGTAIRAQRFDANGTALGTEFVVNTTTTGAQTEPSVAALSGGGFVVSWTDASGATGDSSGTAIRAQRYSNDGTAQGTEWVVNTITTGNQSSPDAEGLPDGTLLITWRDESASTGDTSGSAVRGQRYTADGRALGSEFLVNTTTTGSQTSPSIAALTSGGLAIGYTDSSATGTDTSGSAVRVQRYATNQAPVANDDALRLNNDLGATTLPFLISNDSDGNGDVIQITSVTTTGTTGTVTLANGVVSYNPNGQFNGLAPGATATDTFTYTLSDGAGVTDTATVTVTLVGTAAQPPNSFVSGGVALANFAPQAGGWTDNLTLPRQLADINGDGALDIVGFGTGGVFVSLGNGTGGFAAATLAIANFSTQTGWSSATAFPRQLADVNNDGNLDIVGFGSAGVLVALGDGAGSYAAPTLALANFGARQGWTDAGVNERVLADVNNDGNLDIVGFGSAGVLVSLGDGAGGFAAATLAVNDFGTRQGWANDTAFARAVVDVNGDGVVDIVGFGTAGVLVSLNNGTGTFATTSAGLSNFGQRQGWTSDQTLPRLFGDVTGDGNTDIVGFGTAGVLISAGDGQGGFGAPVLAVNNFGQSQGWTSNTTLPRQLADVNGDGSLDIVGFGTAGVFVATNKGNGTFNAASRFTTDFDTSSGFTSQQAFPRFVQDVTGDGAADVVAVTNSGIVVGSATFSASPAPPAADAVDGGDGEEIFRLEDVAGWDGEAWKPAPLADEGLPHVDPIVNPFFM